MPAHELVILLFLGIMCLTTVVEHCGADVVTYKNHYLYAPRPEYLVIPKYTNKDAPSWPPGNGRSFVDLSR